jgi:hypothetical protein
MELESDIEGNVWGAGMYQGMIAKWMPRPRRRSFTKSPRNGNPTRTQQSMVSPQFSHIDGKVWTNNQDDHSTLRLDVKTGKFENLGVAKNAEGRPSTAMACAGSE